MQILKQQEEEKRKKEESSGGLWGFFGSDETEEGNEGV